MQVTELRQEFLMEEDRPFDSCHAATLLTLKDGGLLAAYFAGSWEGTPDTAIWVSRRTTTGWQPPVKAADIHGIPMWNPVLYRLPCGTIRLFFKVGPDIPDWKTFFADSLDEGESFSAPRELVPGDETGGRGPVKNKPIRLKDGTILAPASTEKGGLWDAFVDISKDGGETWQRSEKVPVRRVLLNQADLPQVIDRPYDPYYLFGRGMIQPTLWEDGEGIVHMLCRTTTSRIFRSHSTDGGRTWSLARDTGLPNNNSGIDLAQLEDGRLVLACNPRENLPGQFRGPRTPLTVSVSEDNGETFTKLFDLENTAGGFAYPAVLAEGNRVHIVYTWNRERIRYTSFRLE